MPSLSRASVAYSSPYRPHFLRNKIGTTWYQQTSFQEDDCGERFGNPQLRLQVKSRWSSSGWERQLVHSDRLAVILNDLGGRDGTYGFGRRKEIADKARYRVEDKIDKIVEAIAAEPIERRAAEEEERRREAYWAERERQRRHADWLKHRETLRHDLLKSLTAANHERHEIRALLETLPTKCRKNDPRYAAFIRWSKRRLQSLDDQLSADSIVGRLRKRRLFEAEDDVKA